MLVLEIFMVSKDKFVNYVFEDQNGVWLKLATQMFIARYNATYKMQIVKNKKTQNMIQQ